MLACVACNKHKADRTPVQAKMKSQAAEPADVEAALCGLSGADRKLVEVPQRSVLEREAGGMNVEHAPGLRAGSRTADVAEQ